MALGASRRSVTRMVLRQAFTMVLVGIGAGLAGTVVAARFVAALLYDVRPNDPLTLAGVSALLVAVAMVASYLPARRATAIDPVKALRNE